MNRGKDICNALKTKTNSLNIENIQNEKKLAELKLKKRGFQHPISLNNLTQK